MTNKKSTSKKSSKHKVRTVSYADVKKKNNKDDLKAHYMWPVTGIIIGIAFIILVFAVMKHGPCMNTGNELITTPDAQMKDEMVYFYSESCEPCNSIEPTARDLAKKANLEFRKVKYPQEVAIPGYLVIVGDETSAPTGIESADTLTVELCQITDNEEICNDAEATIAAMNEQKALAEQEKLAGIPKTAKPVVDMFVMSHCPFGTQIEKGMLPVKELLGDKAEINVRFVYYAMHGQKELDEQLNQYCIQKDQPEKFDAYLACFLEAGDGEGCLNKAAIDTAAMNTCTDAADKEFKVTEGFNDKSTWLSGRYPIFGVDQELNTKYDVGGSPTLIINGAEARAGRDSASLLQAVCAAFENAPEECNTELSSAQPSPGFGYSTTNQDTQATCG